MLLLILAYAGGVLTIISPCILPVLPFVFARADQPFVRGGLPLLLGMALTFTAMATLAAVGGGWAVAANEYGRLAALALLALFGIFATGCLLALEHAGSLAALFAHPAHGMQTLLFLVIVGSLDYPSRLFYRWRRSLRLGRAPMISIQQQFRVIWILRGNMLLVLIFALLVKHPLP